MEHEIKKKIDDFIRSAKLKYDVELHYAAIAPYVFEVFDEKVTALIKNRLNDFSIPELALMREVINTLTAEQLILENNESQITDDLPQPKKRKPKKLQ
jgi:hypothetical protein